MGEDYSLTACFIMVTTLVGIDLIFSLIKKYSTWFDRIGDGAPLIVVDHGKYLKNRMDKGRVQEDDILEAARSKHGLEKLEQIKYAVLERDGSISIIPK